MKFIVGVILLVFLVACGGPKLEAGTVIDKEYTPSYTWMMTTYNPTLKMVTTQPIYVADSWVLTLEACHNQGQTKICERDNRSVDETVFSLYDVGDVYP